MIKVLIVDDHFIVRRGIKQLLQEEPEFAVSGEAADGRQALDLLDAGVETDVLLADVNMPVMDGLALAKEVRGKYQDLTVVLLSMQEDEHFVQEAFNHGITSYVFKTSNPEELIFALKQAYSGKSYVCSTLTERLIKRTSTISNTLVVKKTTVEFSSREMEVLRLIADGLTNEEAADKLFTSRRTVEGHRQSMIDKTGCRNSLALVRFAMQHGLLD